MKFYVEGFPVSNPNILDINWHLGVQIKEKIKTNTHTGAIQKYFDEGLHCEVALRLLDRWVQTANALWGH